jgi:Predicted hydrolase (metallo-beta-lactamase superfamily)
MTGPRIQIRMFNVGFGDCFLVRFSGPDGNYSTMLIDCGAHTAGKGGVPLETIVEDLIGETTAAGADHAAIDVIVATHRHRDHVQGFTVAGWENVTVREVWMPWTEDPVDPDARSIRERQSKSALTLAAALKDAPAAPAVDTANALIGNSLTNDAAMGVLHSGFAGSPVRYFMPRKDPTDPRSSRFTTDALPGVTVQVLGPPRDEATIRDTNPPDGKAFLKLNAAGTELGQAGRSLPFDAWVIADRDYRTTYEHLDLARLGDVVNAGRDEPGALAVALEQSVNNTSLMLMFEFGRHHLLFTGDAQWGTWDHALRDPASRAILAQTTFYKVGHHGSHNATPREFVEELLHDVSAALVSVAPTSIASWKDIPRPPLLDALKDPGRCHIVVRSDQKAPTDPIVTAAGDGSWIQVDLDA